MTAKDLQVGDVVNWYPDVPHVITKIHCNQGRPNQIVTSHDGSSFLFNPKTFFDAPAGWVGKPAIVLRDGKQIHPPTTESEE